MDLRPALLALLACGPEPATTDPDPPVDRSFKAMTFNAGTSTGMGHDQPPEDGYTDEMSALTDTWYRNSLSWNPAEDALTEWLAEVDPQLIAFQEIFWDGWCEEIPATEHDMVCNRPPTGLTQPQRVAGPGHQVACIPDKPDACLVVDTSWATIRGCEEDLCLAGLRAAPIAGCSKSARVGRAELDLVDGGSLTVVIVHGSSGITTEEEACRVKQFEQIFVDQGGLGPAASPSPAIVLGDLNTDPGRWAGVDPSAERFAEFVGDGAEFRFLSPVGEEAPRSYQGLVDIDHVVAAGLSGGCEVAGISEGLRAVVEARYFDHRPVVCRVGD
jgi:hypothetical protein